MRVFDGPIHNQVFFLLRGWGATNAAPHPRSNAIVG
jgi:hypothetical protein